MATTIGVAAAFFSPRVELPLKPVLLFGLALVPRTGEVIGNLANLQTMTALGLVWLVIAKDTSTARQHAMDLIVALVLGVTGVYSILVAPLFILRAVARKTLPSIGVAVVIIVTASFQAWTLRNVPPIVIPGVPLLPVDVGLQIAGLRMAGCLILPPGLAADLPRGLWLGVGLLLVPTLAFAAMAPGRDRWQRTAIVWVAVSVVIATLHRFRMQEYGALFAPQLGDRYFYLPHVCGAWRLVMAASRIGRARYLVLPISALPLVAAAFSWRYIPLIDLNWAQYASRLDAGTAIREIQINPAGYHFSYPGKKAK